MDETPHDTTTPAALRAARQALGLKQHELAEALGMHVASIRRMEYGQQPIEARTSLAVECLLRRAAHRAESAP